jgi:hypothetical protein
MELFRFADKLTRSPGEIERPDVKLAIDSAFGRKKRAVIPKPMMTKMIITYSPSALSHPASSPMSISRT